MDITLSIVIVEYNSIQEILACVASLEKHIGVPFEVIVSSNSCYSRQQQEAIDRTDDNVRWLFNKPVIATNVGGLPEMVKDRHYGLIVKEKDVEALAESIVSLWRDPDLTASFSEEIRRDYSTGEKSWRHIATLLQAEYHIINE